MQNMWKNGARLDLGPVAACSGQNPTDFRQVCNCDESTDAWSGGRRVSWLRPGGRAPRLCLILRCDGRGYRVRSRVLCPKTHLPSGLQSVTLAREGQQHTRYVHRLVADAFCRNVIECRAEVEQITK